MRENETQKTDWIAKHLVKHPFPVEYLARATIKGKHIPMTAEQFKQHKDINKHNLIFEPPLTHKAVFPYKGGEDVLWFTDNDIQNLTLGEIQARYSEWKENAEAHNEPRRAYFWRVCNARYFEQNG